MVFWLVLAIVLVYGVILFNSLVSVKNAVAKAWANIDVLLKQRHDELPKLVDTCKQYMQHEQATLEKVIQARARVADARESQNIGALGSAEGALRSGLGRLFALVESYPELKAKQFPELVIAKWFKFKRFEMLQFASEQLKDVDIGQRFTA